MKRTELKKLVKQCIREMISTKKIHQGEILNLQGRPIDVNVEYEFTPKSVVEPDDFSQVEIKGITTLEGKPVDLEFVREADIERLKMEITERESI